MTWHEIIVPDPDAQSGASVRRFLDSIVGPANIRWVQSDDLAGAIVGLRDQERIALPVGRFLDLVADATQYDWAFFFLHEGEPKAWPLDATHLDMIADAKVTLRLFDDSDFFVYTQDDALAEHLQRAHSSATYRRCAFEELSFPY
jgi:hypothetical protein